MSDSTHETEEWRWIPGYEGLYKVSSLGRVWSEPHLTGNGNVSRGRILKPVVDRKTGRHSVALYRPVDRAKRYRIHNLVTLAFLGPRPEGLLTRHLNDVQSDNRLINLCYGTDAENAMDRLRNGRHFQASQTHCKYGHPFDDENTRYRSDGRGRMCRECHREAGTKQRAKRAAAVVRCSTSGCDKPIFARGLCSACYTRQRSAERRPPDWASRTCGICGAPFTLSGEGCGKKKYCSSDCYNVARMRANRENMRRKRRKP